MIAQKGAIISGVFYLSFSLLLLSLTLIACILTRGILIARNFISSITQTDRQLLQTTRYSVLFVAVVALYFSLGDSTIFEMISASYSLVLVSAFIPLVFGLHTRFANSFGSFLSALFGLVTWIYLDNTLSEEAIVPVLIWRTPGFTRRYALEFTDRDTTHQKSLL